LQKHFDLSESVVRSYVSVQDAVVDVVNLVVESSKHSDVSVPDVRLVMAEQIAEGG